MFKKYDQNQQFLLPVRLDSFVPEDHIARIINDIIDAVDITAIESTYSENGSPAYYPRLMLKILLSSEPVFGQMKQNSGFRKLLLIGGKK